MLGDIIVEAHGKLENKGILGVEEVTPQIEVTISKFGQIHGIDVSMLVTYLSTPNGDGTICAEVDGAIMTKDNNETVTWKGKDIGKMSGQPN